MIGVTGASGRLGRALASIAPIVSIGRHIPNERYSVIIHAAAPRATDEEGLANFDTFNLQLRSYCDRYKPKIINIGSCWQILDGSCRNTTYARLKLRQTALFEDAVTVIPYWIFGPQRGFIFDVVNALRQHRPLRAAGSEHRDFISVTDVAWDVITALDCQANSTWASCSMQSKRPIDITESLGWDCETIEPTPSAVLAYPYLQLNMPRMSVDEYIGMAAPWRK